MDEIQTQPAQAPKELSKQTIVVLVALVVLVSLLGTLTVMNEVGKVQPTTTETPGISTTQAKVSLTIVPPGESSPQGIDLSTGRVVMNIVPRED